MSLELFLIRHARAEAIGPDGTDESRRLTPEGRERFQRSVLALERLRIRFDQLLTSPWTRSYETAELLAPLVDGEIDETPWLARSPQPQLLEEVRGKRVALVGHQPWMSELCAWLLTGYPEDGASLPFAKGGVAWLRGDPVPGGMKLDALMAPRFLRGLR